MTYDYDTTHCRPGYSESLLYTYSGCEVMLIYIVRSDRISL